MLQLDLTPGEENIKFTVAKKLLSFRLKPTKRFLPYVLKAEAMNRFIHLEIFDDRGNPYLNKLSFNSSVV